MKSDFIQEQQKAVFGFDLGLEAKRTLNGILKKIHSSR